MSAQSQRNDVNKTELERGYTWEKLFFHSLSWSPWNYTLLWREKTSHEQNVVFLLCDGNQASASVRKLVQEAIHFQPVERFNQPLSIQVGKRADTITAWMREMHENPATHRQKSWQRRNMEVIYILIAGKIISLQALSENGGNKERAAFLQSHSWGNNAW